MARINISIMGYPINSGVIPTFVKSFNGRTGDIIPQAGDYTAANVGAEPSGSIASHISSLDPHIQYQTKTELESIILDSIALYDSQILTPIATPLNLRTTTTITTSVLSPNTEEIGQVLLAKSYQLRKIESNVPCRIRLYMTASDLTNDLSRPFITTPPANSGVVIDYQTSLGNLSYRFDYPIEGYDDEAVPDGLIPFSITNLDASSQSVELSITFLRTE
jgi:hypothetical protein